MELIRRFVAQFPLALVTSQRDGQWQSSHIPLFFDDSSDVLFAHVDAQNAQFATTEPFSVHVVFAGPNLYIPPEAYISPQLPTWNYLAVHATGTMSVSDDETRNLEILRKTALQLAPTPSAFRVEDTDHRVRQWIGGIRGLRLELSEIEGRFKLSQDKPPQDIDAAAQYFAKTASEQITSQMLLTFAGRKQRAEHGA
jgi:transcriptional regulator